MNKSMVPTGGGTVKNGESAVGVVANTGSSNKYSGGNPDQATHSAGEYSQVTAKTGK